MKFEDEQKEKSVLSRRQLLKCGAAVGAGLLVANTLKVPKALAQVPASCPPAPTPWTLTPFADRLPRIPTLRGIRRGGVVYYKVSTDQTVHTFHSQLPPTPVWAFNGMVPGPTFNVFHNEPVEVTFANNLQSYLACPDMNVHGTYPVPYITIHNHGLMDREDSDGFPEDRYPPGVSYTYEYPNIDRAATFWYHDHNLGVTRIALYSGLAGFYLSRDACELQLNLPKGRYEVPLILQDKLFNADGSLWFPYPWAPEFLGDYISVNGKIWPYMSVGQGKYRFRILNASNARFYNLQLNPPPPPGAFMMIGTDGGLLPAPVDLTNPASTPMGGLLLGIAERGDVIIDFSAYPPGTKVTLTNNAPAPFPGGVAPTPGVGPGLVMQFNVTATPAWPFPIPSRLCPLPNIKPPVLTRYNTLVDYGSPIAGYPPPPPNYPYPTLLLNNLEWMIPPTETPAAGSTEIWNLISLAPDTHPIHVHQTQFKILDRQPFDAVAYIAQYGVTGPVNNPVIPFTGPAVPPFPFEAGLKDTVRADPYMVTRIEIPFGPFRGRFVWHCHMLDHEDNEMMRPLMIV